MNKEISTDEQELKKEQDQLIKWIRTHKKQLKLAGVCCSVLILLILLLRNKEKLQALWGTLRETIIPSDGISHTTVSASTSAAANIAALFADDPSIPIEVRKHIRNLPKGWHASAEKIAEALANGIILQEGQTWVTGYVKWACA